MQAIKDSLEKLSNSEIQVQVIHAGTGNLNESDVLLANASDAVVMLFHMGLEPRAEELAARNELEVRRYDIIYDLVADVKAAMEGLRVAGSMVIDGKVTRGSAVVIYRGTQKMGDGKITSLKRFKDDVSSVEKGLDCGILIEGYQDFQKGDRFEVIVKEKRTRRLEAAK